VSVGDFSIVILEMEFLALTLGAGSRVVELTVAIPASFGSQTLLASDILVSTKSPQEECKDQKRYDPQDDEGDHSCEHHRLLPF
jgi:hypothetical protein